MTDIDPNTLEVMKVMGVEVDDKPKVEVPRTYSLEEIKEFLESLDEQNKNLPPAPEMDVVKEVHQEVVGGGEQVQEQPQEQESPQPNEPEQKQASDSFENILKELEELSKERADAADKVEETQQQLKEKMQQVEDGTSTADTIKEIVELNAKLQTELEVYKNADAANKAKIKELTEKINYYELDDSRMNVPDDLKNAVKYLIHYYESKNETFKIKAMEEMVKTLEKLGEHPVGPYVDDVIAKQLKLISSLSGDSPSSPVPETDTGEDGFQTYVRTHGVPKEL